MANSKKTFGELIREYLEIKGWKQAELSRRTGFSETYIGNLIRDSSPGTKSGKPTRIPSDTVDRIANALGMPVDLARRCAGLASPIDEQEKQQLRNEIDTIQRQSIELLRLFYLVTSEDRETILRILKNLEERYIAEEDLEYIEEGERVPNRDRTKELPPRKVK